MDKNEMKLKWYIIMFASWLTSIKEDERNHILTLDQPAMLLKFEMETIPPPGNITYCNKCKHIFVTTDHPTCQCPHCKATLNMH